jgi:hypothetical protein
MRDYIRVKKHWFEMYTKFDKPYFTPQLKFPIERIKMDKATYPNEMSRSDMLYMLVNFDREAWMPILLNKEDYLLDGQPRLEVARQMGLSFIDVIIEDTELLKTSSKKYSNSKKCKRWKELMLFAD